jgi:hypothetical protein
VRSNQLAVAPNDIVDRPLPPQELTPGNDALLGSAIVVATSCRPEPRRATSYAAWNEQAGQDLGGDVRG